MSKTPMQQAREAQQARASRADLKLTAQMLAGDHWADGRGWVGPMPSPKKGEEREAALIMQQVGREFVSRNLLANVVGRHLDGIAGREPLWTLDNKGAEAALATWWENSGAWLSIRKALKTAIWSGKGTLRLFIPASKLVDVGGSIPAGLNLAQALGFVSVHAPEWNQAGVFRDHENRVLGAYYAYADALGQQQMELQLREQGESRVIPAAMSDEEAGVLYPTPDLLLFEVSLEPLISESLRRLNMFANKVLTMSSRNINLGGFTERTILNAQMPGEWKDGKFQPSAYHVGAGVTNFLTGVALRERNPVTGDIEPTGNFSSPSIQYKDPAGWQIFGDTLAAIREAIFDEAKQLHVLITGDATASGVSRVQAVQDFMSSLEPTRHALEQMVRWLLATVLRLGQYLSGQAPIEPKISVQARLSAVQPTPAEIDAAVRLHEAGHISRETLHARIGVEDSAAEVERMGKEALSPAMALKIAGTAPQWLGLRALQLAFPALQIADEDIEKQKALDLAEPTEATDGPTA